MSEPLRILIVEDRNADFLMVQRHLKKNGLAALCSRVDRIDGLKEALDSKRWDLVLTDYNLPQLNFQESLNLLLTDIPEVPVIMVTGTLGEEKAVEILKQGVCDFVLKENLARLVPAILRSLKEKRELKGRYRAEERLTLAMQGANDGLWDWNLATGDLFFSPRWKSMVGYADKEMANSYDSWEELVHPEDLEHTLTRMRDFMEGTPPSYEVEFRMRHKLGHYVDILSRAFALHSARGEVVRMVGTHVDVTEMKKLEAQCRQTQKMEAVGQLAGGVAHDFNNILSIISGYTHLILEQVGAASPVRNYVEQIAKAGNRAAVLTKSLLAYSRKQPVALAVIDLGEVVRGLEPFFRKLIREDLELEINCSAAPLKILADRGQLEQVLMNLVTNARDAMPNSGRLSLETAAVTLDRAFIDSHGYGKKGAYASFSIADNGSGMDQETQSHIFEPFFTTKEQGKGTGLGLSMAYGIVKKHDGFIEVQSEPGTGTTVSIYLPSLSCAAEVEKKELLAPVALQGGSETILVCEDDEPLRRLTVKVLSHFGYRVIEAVDGQDAVDKFLAHKDEVALVLIDAIMPKKNGNLANREMKRHCPALKTIFVSGYPRDIFDQADPFDANTVFIHKPIHPKDLLAQVRKMLDRK